jgi:hypothetical protein
MIQKSKAETPIEEIHRIRREISDRFGGDIAAIAADAARRARESGRRMWQPKATNQAMQRRGGGDVSENGESTPAAR